VRRIVLAALLAAGCAAQHDMRSDWERRNIKPEPLPDEALVLPAFPAAARLVEIPVEGAPGYRFFVDPASVSAGRDGVVRYTVVARSPAGADNVFYEGLRCARKEYRVYAVGRPDATWGGRQGEWRALASGPATQPWRTVLNDDYFCPQSDPIRTASEGVEALERGGHPMARRQIR
jgi:hypothetical protein